MEIKVDEETAEKLRWEERCRNWRSCAELNRVRAPIPFALLFKLNLCLYASFSEQQKLQALESASKDSKVDKTEKVTKRLLLKQGTNRFSK